MHYYLTVSWFDCVARLIITLLDKKMKPSNKSQQNAKKKEKKNAIKKGMC